MNAGQYPDPDDAFFVTYSGGTVWKQGTAGSGMVQKMTSIAHGGIGQKPSDPLLGTDYSYSTLAYGRGYQILAKTEAPLGY